MSKPRMQCYYDVLQVERDADDDELKKNYRKLALQWHPDKNISREDEAKEKFQLIQQAWEVLNDPQERAWYDRHRDQILKGNQSNYEDDSLDVYAFFTTSCYKGHCDGDEGFYSVYRTVFEKISAEDIEYMDNPEEFETIPKFGDSSSSFEDVVNFYGHWESYSTKKSYAWLFTHNINEIRDRRVLKLVDKEHKKIQQKARKERNEEIRSLVLFVKKRDKRMAEYKKMLEDKAQQNRLKSQQNRLEQIQKRNEQIKEQQKNSKVTSEHQEELRQLEESYLNQYSDSEGEASDVEDIEDGMENCDLNGSKEVYEDALYCVACNKFFNSESAKLNHEASKKHTKNMELLKTEMNAEEESHHQKQKLADELKDPETETGDDDVSEAEEAQPAKKPKGKKSKKKNKKVVNYEDSDSEHELEHKIMANDKVEEFPVVEEILLKASDEDDDWSNSKKAKKSKTKGKVKNEKSKPSEIEPSVEELPVSMPMPSEPQAEDDSTEHRCATCRELFPSKNKLFAHLKKTNHSIYLKEVKGKVAEKVSLKKKK